jgi:hypothetical protein
MTLGADEFMRRFLLHVLPSGFHRIRRYGLLAKPSRKAVIAQARQFLRPTTDTPSSFSGRGPRARATSADICLPALRRRRTNEMTRCP